jgi:hypothetical protein
LRGRDIVLICHCSQCYKNFRQYVSTVWPPGTPVVPSQYRVQWHNSTFGICPNMGSRLLPRIVTTITSILIFSHSVFDSESRPRRNVFSVSGHYLLLAPAMFKNPKLSITFSYAEILTSTVFHNHIGIVWIMSASLCSSEILWSNYTPYILILCGRISKISMSNI